MVLSAIYEPSFRDSSHGFRPGRGCHTALRSIKKTFTGVSWFIEGDISKCFDSFNHARLIEALKERIDDRLFIGLLNKALIVGYTFQNKYFVSQVGSPQGSIISPILCNVLLHKLDSYMERYKTEFDIGARRKTNPLWDKLRRQGRK